LDLFAEMPFVSIICPYRNSLPFLQALAANVRSQTFLDWELILIDDSSLDGGAEVAHLLARKDSRIRSLSAPVRGKADPDGPWWPRNYGIACSQGQLIAFLDVDDLWHPTKLERQIHYLATTNSDLCITGYARFADQEVMLRYWRLPPETVHYARLRVGNAIPLLTVLIKREFISHGFRPAKHEDYLLWLDSFRARPDMTCSTVPELLAFHRRHKNNFTSSRIAMAIWAYSVFSWHGCSIVSSMASLVPWFANQYVQWIRCFRNPLLCTLSHALEVPSALRLPPKAQGSSRKSLIAAPE